jgi:2,7-dihydroxy-5-methyl-1-naphthoate 7-O-methyltransferase
MHNGSVSHPHYLIDMVDLVPAYALRAAASLGLADLIVQGCDSAESLAAAAEANLDAMRRLMRYLCVRNVFAGSADGQYGLTDFSVLLLDGHPSGLRRTLNTSGYAGRVDRAIAELPGVIRTGKPAYPQLFGRSVYTDFDADPAIAASFDMMRAEHSAGFAADVAARLLFNGFECVVDVGGGTGTLLVAALERFPALKGVLIDLPRNENRARALFRRAGVEDRCEFVAGDFFRQLPPADGYLLCDVLYNWDDDDADRIIGNCVIASPAAPLVVVERALASSHTEATAAQDLLLLAVCGGRLRTVADFTRLMANHNHVLAGQHAVAGDRVVLQFERLAYGG